MNRRKFLQATTAGLAFSALSKLTPYAAEFADQKKRVGLIGTGFDRAAMHRIAEAHKKAPGSVVIKALTQRWTEYGQVHHAVFEELIG